MTATDVVLVTEARWEAPAQPDWYAQQILDDDAALIAGLRAHGLSVERIDWERADYDWSAARCAVFRTPWNYFERFEAFTRWLDRVEGATQLLNPASLVRWNLDKRYLADLDARGVRIVPTRFVTRGARVSLAALVAEAGWQEVVIKPAVSGAARNTHRIAPAALRAHEARFRELLASDTMLIQPFQPDVLTAGEVSLMVIDGEVTHAVRKRARPGDYRVQDDHGGTVHAHQPTAEEIAFAEHAIAACRPRPLYGRVDVVRDTRGELAVMELELVEPELWLRRCEHAARRLADGIARTLAR